MQEMGRFSVIKSDHEHTSEEDSQMIKLAQFGDGRNRERESNVKGRRRRRVLGENEKHESGLSSFN